MNKTSRVACNMSTAPDTPEERAAEYQHLFATALSGPDRTARMVGFRFRADAVDETKVQSLAAREQACCPFCHIDLRITDDPLWWDTSVDDNLQAKAVLEELPAWTPKDLPKLRHWWPDSTLPFAEPDPSQ